MTHITHSIIIARPVEEVFTFVTDLENDRYWWRTLSLTRKLTAGPVRLGTEFDQAAQVGWAKVRNHLRITDWQPPSQAVYRNESAQLAYTVVYTFTPEAGGTRYRLAADLEPKGLLKWLLPLTLRVLRGQLDSHFKGLKAYLESPAHAARMAQAAEAETRV